MDSEHIYDVVSYILGACIGLFGICGNIAAFIGFQKQSKKTSTSFLFQALTITDTGVLITFALWTSWPVLQYDVPIILYLGLIALNQMAILASNGVNVLLTVTRFIDVCFPPHASRYCSIARVRCYLIATIFVLVAFIIPYMLHFFRIEIISSFTLTFIYRPLMYFALPVLIITTITLILVFKL